MFGKKMSEYAGIQGALLAALVVVGVVRLALSLSGLPDATVKWVALNAVLWPGFVYCGLAARRAGFLYKQLLPLALLQALVFHSVAVLGILLQIAGFANIYAAPEYSPPAPLSPWIHIAAHLTVGMLAVSLIGWGTMSLVMLIGRKLSPARAAA
jgi:hypothetical protein